MSETSPQLHQEAITVLDTIEDTVEYLCDENLLSGEKVWVMISALCDAKLAQFPLEYDNEDWHIVRSDI